MMKTLTVLAAVGTIAIAAVAAPAPAEARNNGAAVAAGVVGGLALGAIVGSQANRGYYASEPAPYYYGTPYARSCYVTRERVWTDRGPRWRKVRVCD